jgi:hypothetical protein
MLIDDAVAIYYGETDIYKVYLGSNVVWGISYLTSQENVTAGGYTIGDAVNKTTAIANKTTLSTYAPGASFTASRKYWTDWGDDIFDSWGFFYIYDPQVGNYLAINMANMQEADGVISQETFSLNGRTFTVNYGYPVQGIFKIDVIVNDRDSDFIFGMDGNLGSDSATINSVLSQDYSLGGQDFKLHYNYNYQGTNPPEKFYTYFVPYELLKNKTTRSYTRHLYSTDNLSLYSVPVKRGITIYVAKHNDVKNWIINDLQLGIE